MASYFVVTFWLSGSFRVRCWVKTSLVILHGGGLGA